MIRLNTTTRSLRAFLAGAITTSQLAVTVGYSDGTSAAYTGAAQLSLTNGVTPVTICAAPASGVVRHIDYIAVSNTDTAAATVTIQLNDNGTFYEQVKATLPAGRQLVYTHASGWNVGDVNATPIGANPSASVGLAAVNGTALTFMRSDAAPALSQSITPTWTGAHVFSNTVAMNGGVTLGDASGDALTITSGAFSAPNNLRMDGAATTRWQVNGTSVSFMELMLGGVQQGYYAAGATNTELNSLNYLMMTINASERIRYQTNGDVNFVASKLYPSTPAKATQSTAALHAGSGAPNNADGNNGDYYFRSDTPGTANQRLYVKSAGAWVGIV